MRYWLVMPAAGAGRRFGATRPKQYAPLAGRTVIEWALAPVLADPRCRRAVVALAPGDDQWHEVAVRLGAPVGATRAAPAPALAPGGTQRSLSVRSALALLADRARPEDWVLVHDAARPCLAAEDLQRLIAALEGHPLGGLLASRVADTLKQARAGAGGNATLEAKHTVTREEFWRALTPQMFRYARLCAALDAAHAAGRFPSDEAQALEWSGAQPLLIEGSSSNLKITTSEDLVLAGALLRTRHAAGGEGRPMRIGSGIDVHAFGPGDHLMLGGVRIAHSHGVVAHSDGDVVLHALCDALLGAAGLGDIGQHFSDRDVRWKGADSSRFVTEVLGLLRGRRLAVENADVTVLAQVPRVAVHREAMRRRIAQLLEVEEERVNIKATTTEGRGFLGRAEGIAAQAVVLLSGS